MKVISKEYKMENFDDDDFSTDSSEESEVTKKQIVEDVQKKETHNFPQYTDEEMHKLLLFIQQIATSYELSEEDIDESFTENVTKFLMRINETYLFVYFDCGFLSASPGCPASVSSQLTYFIREKPGHAFTINGFHDEIAFGTIQENVLETILMLFKCIYAPLILKNKLWDESVKSKLFIGLHSFMAYITDVNSKIGSAVLLYVPNEGNGMTVEQAVLDKALVKRLENVIIYWISQIRLCLSDMENIVQNELSCPSDEHDFWIYKFEVLSGIKEQIRHEDIKHIVSILDKSQSLFINQFNKLRFELSREIQLSRSNVSFLKLLVTSCTDLQNCDLPKDVLPKVPKIIHLIRVISLNSDYYNNKTNTERLFSYLNNEIISFCKSKVNTGRILSGSPRFGINICDMCIDCCLSYKLIFKRLVEELTCKVFTKTWAFDEVNIFNQINIFIQRLYDIIEVCKNFIVFGRVDETVSIPRLNFGCHNAREFMTICEDVERKFGDGLKIIKNSSDLILNVHNRLWHKEMASFKMLIRSLEEVIKNLLVNVLITIDNIEEALDVLTAMHSFSQCKNLQNEYNRCVEAIWAMFEIEIIGACKETTRSAKEHLACLPNNAGKSLNLHIRMRKCERLRDLLLNAHYIAKVPSTDDRLKMFETTMINIKYRILRYSNEWSNQIIGQPNTHLNRFLIIPSSSFEGLLESNIDHNILQIFEEAKYFEFMEVTLTLILTAIHAKFRKIMSLFNKVANVVLLHNKILSSLSAKEQLLFKQHIKLMQKKIAPGLFRLTYSDELTEPYINECLMHLSELQHFVDIYKTINMVNARIFEEISNDSVMKIQFSPIGSLEYFKQRLRETRNTSIESIGVLYRKVIEYIIVVYDGFENQINGEMAEQWVSYIRKIDALAEHSLLNCARNTLTGVIHLLHDNNNSNPEGIIAINITLVDRKIVFDPSLDSISSTIQNIYKDLLRSVKLFPRLNEKFELPETNDVRRFHEVVTDDEKCRTLYMQIVEIIEECLQKINDCVDSWNLFRYIWEIHIEKFMLKYQEKGMEIKEFEKAMLKYLDVESQVVLQATTTTINFVTLNCTELKKELLDYIIMWKKNYNEKFCAAIIQKLQSHQKRLSSTVATLSKHPTSVEMLDGLLELYKQSMREIKMRETDMEEIREYYKCFEKYDIDPPMAVIKNFNAIPNQWKWYNQKLHEINEILYIQKEQFKMGLLTKSTALRNDINEMIDKIDQQIPTASDINSTDARKILSKLYAKVESFVCTEKAINSQSEIFSLSEVVNYELKSMVEVFDTTANAWKLISEWENLWEEYKVADFWSINVENLEELVASLSKKINKTNEINKDRKWDFLIVNKQHIELFQRYLPMIVDLKNSAMKNRHWKQIKDLAQIDFDECSPNFNLMLIMEMRFHDLIEQIQDISNSATMELQIETNIKNIIEAWETLRFEVVQYKDAFLKIQGVDECLQAFEEHCVLISNMKATKFVEPLKDVVNEWETKLSFVSEIIENILQIQKKWLYLDRIFEGDDIRREMKTEVANFINITIEFQEILHQMELKTTAIEATHYKDPSYLLNQISELLEKLEMIQHALEMYLETKRNIFPRFFFISNDDLLEILGNSKHPLANQIHMKKLFDNVNKLELAQVPINQRVQKWQAIGMYAGDGELVKYQQPVVLEGAVENYLNLIEIAMRSSLKLILMEARDALKVTKLPQRNKWMEYFPGQLCIIASALKFTNDCIKSLKLCNLINDRKPLKSFIKQQKKLLMRLSEISRQGLQHQMRLKTNAIITIEIHKRDIIERMYNSNCKDTSHFEWFSQLKYVWNFEKNDCQIMQTNTSFIYQYEYTGNSGRLCVTPLTDRCYITLTTALHLYRGASLQGPAGTGKTETTKDLAKCLGLWAVVNNCSEGLDYKSIGKCFSGLCQSGCWGCFDEFNRINIEVLSVVAQQILSILSALSMKTTKFIFEGSVIKLVNTTAIFITMNPGYAGRTELPENLKSMFRPISVMVPDNLIIAENLLFSDGFINASIMAKKVVTLYDLSKLQLSKQFHYDFGLRSMVALLRYAGMKKRENPTISEEEIVYLAMRDMNLAKLTYDDLPLFTSIMNDIFPSVEVPIIKHEKFISAIKAEIKKIKLQEIPVAISKVIQLYETKCSRHSVILLGETNTAKSATWKLLKGTCCTMKTMNAGGFEHVQEHVINPKSVGLAELYGEYNLATGEWNDGILSSIMRKICADESKDHKWLLFDGPIDAVWIENMNSVMDDNKLLTLINSERITMPEQVSLLFEVSDLSVASPATISRCGMVYNDYKDWSWRPFINSWLDGKQKNVQEFLSNLLNRYLSRILEYKEKNCIEIVTSNELNLIQSFCKLWDCFATTENGMDLTNDDALETVGKMWFFFCIIWSICALVNLDGRRKIDALIRDLEGIYPIKDTVYEYYVDGVRKTFVQWESQLDENWRHESEIPFYKILVPTADTIRYGFILSNLLKKKHPILLVGEVGTGKSSLVMSTLEAIESSKNMLLKINMSAQTTSNILQDTIESRTEKRTKNMYVPIGGKYMITFIDDFNMPMKDQYGSQPPLELIRQWMDYGFWYDRRKQNAKYVNMMMILAAMGPVGGGRQAISSRTLSRFSIVNVAVPSESTTYQMFSKILNQHFEGFPTEVSNLVDRLTKSTIKTYEQVTKKMLPTPLKFHYLFNLRDVSKVFQGLVRTQSNYHNTKLIVLRLWIHEMQRVFCDRLIDDADRNWFNEQLSKSLSLHFDSIISTVCPGEKLPLFGNFANPMEIYEDLKNSDQLRDFFQNKIDDYNSIPSSVKMHLIFFGDAVMHLVRIIRVISQARGHMLVVGIAGSGRQSLCLLAAYVAELGIFRVKPTGKYKTQDFKEDLKNLYKSAGVKGKPTMFLVSDVQLRNEMLFEIINNMLSTGEVTNLFKSDELEEHKQELKKLEPSLKNLQSTEETYSIIIERAKVNMHIVVCMSPIGEQFRSHVRQYPAIINCTTIDWFCEWPEEAFLEISHKYFSNLTLSITIEDILNSKLPADDPCEEKLRKSLSTVSSLIHLGVIEESKHMLMASKRTTYITPSGFLELVIGFGNMLESKRRQFSSIICKFRNGLSKIDGARDSVELLSREMVANKERNNLYTLECDEYLIVIKKQKQIADQERIIVGNQKENVIEETAKVWILKEQADKELAAVMPGLMEALAALDTLNRKDITEIKSYVTPPIKVEKVLEAVMLLLERPPEWSEAKRKLGEQSFLEDLKKLDKNKIADKTLKKLDKYVSDPEFEPTKVGAVSVAAKSLCKWVRAMKHYGENWKVVGPKQSRVNELERNLHEMQEGLVLSERRLEDLAKSLEQLSADYNDKMLKKAQLTTEADKLALRLERAQILVKSLIGERQRWIDTEQELMNKFQFLIGDCLLATTFLNYLGPFTSKYRERMLKIWIKQAREHEIPISEDILPTTFISDPATIREWNLQGLPADNFSAENGVLVTSSSKWPILIDPQNQALNWLVNFEDTSLIVTDFTSKEFVKSLEKSMQQGLAVLIQNISEDMPTIMQPILNKSLIRQRGNLMIDFNDKLIDFSPNFRLYFTTRIANPRFAPEIFTHTKVINFSVKEEGLEDQLLGIIVEHERPSLEKQKNELVVDIAANRRTLHVMQNEILRMLNEDRGQVLDDDELFSNLQTSQRTSATVKDALFTSEATEAEIDIIREEYRPAAERASLLYFVLRDMSNIEPMYQFSLAFYIGIFRQSIENSERHPKMKKRIENINNYHTLMVYRNACLGLFEKHKLLFSFYITVKILNASSKLNNECYEFLLKGGIVLDRNEQVANPAPDWITEDAWDNLTELEKLPGFAGIVDSFFKQTKEWKEWFQTSEPENAELDEDWKNSLDDFQKILLVRCFRMDRMVSCLMSFIVQHFGSKFTEPPVLDLNAVFKQSQPTVPLMFVLSPGADPSLNLIQLSELMHMRDRFKILSLGQGQSENAKMTLHEGIQKGFWVFLANCHLSISWLPELEKIIEQLQKSSVNVHKKFRLWLSSSPHPKFPISILQSSIKMTTEPPSGIKANMKRLYNLMTEDTFNQCQAGDKYKRLLFSLTFFHAILIERRKFEQLGWNTIYSFNDSDFDISENILSVYLNEYNVTPWDALKYMIAEINYGGHITDALDKKLLVTYSEDMFNDDVINVSDYQFSGSPLYYMPREGNLKFYIDFVNTLPSFDAPEVFGQHQNANITSLITESKTNFLNLLMLESESVGDVKENKEEKVLQLAQDLLNKKSKKINLDATKKAFERNFGPLEIVLLQEAERYNNMLILIESDLSLMLKCITGIAVLTTNIEYVINSLYSGAVPKSWLFAYPSIKPLGSFYRDLTMRTAFFAKWAETCKAPNVFWLSAFSFPTSFLTAVLQKSSRLQKIPIDNLVFEYNVQPEFEPSIHEVPKNGVYIEGLFLESGSWNRDKSYLQEPKLLELICPMPIIHFKTSTDIKRRSKKIYECPAYYYPIRAARGSVASFITTVDLQTGKQNSSFWIKRATALLLSLSN